MSQKSKGSSFESHLADAIFKMATSLVVLIWHGLIRFVRLFRQKPISTSAVVASGLLAIRISVMQALHLKLMAFIWPYAFSGRFLHWLYRIPIETHIRVSVGSTAMLTLVILGSAAVRERRRLKENFEAIGLVNGLGGTPVLISKHRLDEFRDKYVFKSNALGLNRFEEKQQALESIFQKPIEGLRAGRNPSFIELIVSTKRLKSNVSLQSLLECSPLANENFFIGDGMKGTVTAKIADLPHLLIAGTTGGGKSVFFKQVLLGLLKSSEHMQVYIVDLKKGLEAADFRTAPNVAIAKDAFEAVRILEQVQKEMTRRFKFLEHRGLKTIEPERDQMDRIVVAVDEASELYAQRSKFDDDYEACLEAQKITDSIARLGRAAGIHLILATQKVQKESINTVIQENISARMCFRMNTLQGSLQVLGCKDALELPNIPGRGIWQFGADQFVIQVPNASDAMIQKTCEELKLAHTEGTVSLHQPMLNATENKNREHKKPSLVNLDA